MIINNVPWVRSYWSLRANDIYPFPLRAICSKPAVNVKPLALMQMKVPPDHSSPLNKCIAVSSRIKDVHTDRWHVRIRVIYRGPLIGGPQVGCFPTSHTEKCLSLRRMGERHGKFPPSLSLSLPLLHLLRPTEWVERTPPLPSAAALSVCPSAASNVRLHPFIAPSQSQDEDGFWLRRETNRPAHSRDY